MKRRSSYFLVNKVDVGRLGVSVAAAETVGREGGNLK